MHLDVSSLELVFALSKVGLGVNFLFEKYRVGVLHPLATLLVLQVVDNVLGADDDGGRAVAVDVFDLHSTFAVDLDELY